MKKIPTPFKVIAIFLLLLISIPIIGSQIKPYHSYSGSINYLSTTGNVQFVDDLLIYTDKNDTLDSMEANSLAKLSKHYFIVVNTYSYD